jgi:hypothetical protein
MNPAPPVMRRLRIRNLKVKGEKLKPETPAFLVLTFTF